MTENIYLFDTYAILEILSGNKNYLPYIDCEIIINEFIFAELSYKLLLEENKTKKDTEVYLRKYKDFIVNADFETIIEAMRFRVKHKKKKISMTDCISYVMAKKLGVKFLTGDKEFKNFENVEFVK